MKPTILLVQVHLVLVVSEPEQPLTPSQTLTISRLLPLLQRPPLHDAELLPGAALLGQLPLQPRFAPSILGLHQSHGLGWDQCECLLTRQTNRAVVSCEDGESDGEQLLMCTACYSAWSGHHWAQLVSWHRLVNSGHHYSVLLTNIPWSEESSIVSLADTEDTQF